MIKTIDHKLVVLVLGLIAVLMLDVYLAGPVLGIVLFVITVAVAVAVVYKEISS